MAVLFSGRNIYFLIAHPSRFSWKLCYKRKTYIWLPTLNIFEIQGNNFLFIKNVYLRLLGNDVI